MSGSPTIETNRWWKVIQNVLRSGELRRKVEQVPHDAADQVLVVAMEVAKQQSWGPKLVDSLLWALRFKTPKEVLMPILEAHGWENGDFKDVLTPDKALKLHADMVVAFAVAEHEKTPPPAELQVARPITPRSRQRKQSRSIFHTLCLVLNLLHNPSDPQMRRRRQLHTDLGLDINQMEPKHLYTAALREVNAMQTLWTNLTDALKTLPSAINREKTSTWKPTLRKLDKTLSQIHPPAQEALLVIDISQALLESLSTLMLTGGKRRVSISLGVEQGTQTGVEWGWNTAAASRQLTFGHHGTMCKTSASSDVSVVGAIMYSEKETGWVEMRWNIGRKPDPCGVYVGVVPPNTTQFKYPNKWGLLWRPDGKIFIPGSSVHVDQTDGYAPGDFVSIKVSFREGMAKLFKNSNCIHHVNGVPAAPLVPFVQFIDAPNIPVTLLPPGKRRRSSVVKSKDSLVWSLMHRLANTEQGLMALHDEPVAVLPPMGNVTLVFTDVQSSTLLWEEDPENMKKSLAVHNELFRKLIYKWGGYEVKTEGDAFMIAFSRTSVALHWAMDLQANLLQAEWPEELIRKTDLPATKVSVDGKTIFRGLRIRCGIHTGEPDCERDPVTGRMDYFGPVVNLAARISSVGRGGETIVGGAAFKELQKQGALPDKDIFLKCQGVKQMKGIAKPEPVFTLLPAKLESRIKYWEYEEGNKAQGITATRKDSHLSPSWAKRIGQEWHKIAKNTTTRRRKVSVLEYTVDKLQLRTKWMTHQIEKREAATMNMHDTFKVAVAPTGDQVAVVCLAFDSSFSRSCIERVLHVCKEIVESKVSAWQGYVIRSLEERKHKPLVAFWSLEAAIQFSADVQRSFLTAQWSEQVLKEFPEQCDGDTVIFRGPALSMGLAKGGQKMEKDGGYHPGLLHAAEACAARARNGEIIINSVLLVPGSGNYDLILTIIDIHEDEDNVHSSLIPKGLQARLDTWAAVDVPKARPKLAGSRSQALLTSGSEEIRRSSELSLKREEKVSEIVKIQETLKKKEEYIRVLQAKEDTRRQQHMAELKVRDQRIAELETLLGNDAVHMNLDSPSNAFIPAVVAGSHDDLVARLAKVENEMITSAEKLYRKEEEIKQLRKQFDSQTSESAKIQAIREVMQARDRELDDVRTSYLREKERRDRAEKRAKELLKSLDEAEDKISALQVQCDSRSMTPMPLSPMPLHLTDSDGLSSKSMLSPSQSPSPTTSDSKRMLFRRTMHLTPTTSPFPSPGVRATLSPTAIPTQGGSNFHSLMQRNATRSNNTVGNIHLNIARAKSAGITPGRVRVRDRK
eukprot:TRINITY_DN14563_c0_g2_i3.p1 TRINITY_DN14563_c0_g2~~TRINITY_DN14563_c0_g2_i3.p1  ORF type:complete len:1304 (+),score=337.22 TRINITY_DN14563_c0_g2_i3:34-3945(+)